MPNPNINVTPLIDVLLVLLIIFMVVSPLKPDSFKTRIPSELKNEGAPDPQTLVVIVSSDSSLRLNAEHALGSTSDPSLLIAKLKDVFRQRQTNGVVSQQQTGADRPFHDPIERTVFIKAPKRLDYGSVAHVIDAVKLAGAYPIGLQIDYLD